ncbi:MAG: hypothetical protein ACE5JU_12810 [Candidatus Binatia bacterium]
MSANKNRIARLSNVFSKAMKMVLTDPSTLLADTEKYLDRKAVQQEWLQYINGLPGVVPLNFKIDSSLSRTPTLNVLIPGMAMKSMSGGPNTAINVAYRVAAMGVPMRFISTDVRMDQDHEPLWEHFCSLTGISERLPKVEICCAFDRSKPLSIGENDVFFGTAWWTVQMIKHAIPLLNRSKFIYIIQEFEPGLYPWSTQYALALETYSMNYRAIISEQLLADYLSQYKIGRFSDLLFMEQCAVINPAVDARKFYVEEQDPGRPKRLLFYARPTTAYRNMFELGLYSLRYAVLTGAFKGEQWEFMFMGEALPSVDLGNGHRIKSAPWLDYDSYACLIRNSDIVLSLMLSPHTSYPPLEIAACGGFAVTNTFANKTREKLEEISPNIVAVPPTLEGVVGGLCDAAKRVQERGTKRVGVITLARNWEESLAHVVPKVKEMFEDCLRSTDSN